MTPSPLDALPAPLAPTCPDTGIPAGSVPGDCQVSTPLPGLSIVLPCFNEEATVAGAIRDAASAAARVSEDYEILIVDDGSTDATAEVAARFLDGSGRARLIVHSAQRGYGAAVRSGIRAARMPWVLLTDPELQFDPVELADLVTLTRSADLIIGWRIMRRDPRASSCLPLGRPGRGAIFQRSPAGASRASRRGSRGLGSCPSTHSVARPARGSPSAPS